MNLDDFVKVFETSSFVIRRVERGEHEARKKGWLIQFTTDYFTSDTDRLCDGQGHGPFGWGDTLEEAIDDLVKQHLEIDERRMVSAQNEARRLEMNLAGFRTALARSAKP